jgi:hypothetical protein
MNLFKSFCINIVPIAECSWELQIFPAELYRKNKSNLCLLYSVLNSNSGIAYTLQIVARNSENN